MNFIYWNNVGTAEWRNECREDPRTWRHNLCSCKIQFNDQLLVGWQYNTGLGSESGSMPGFIFFVKECNIMVRARVSVNHNPNPNLKTAFFYKKRYTPIPIPMPTPRFTDTRPSWGSGFESRQPKLWRWVVKSLCNLRILFSSSKTSKGTPFQTTSAKFG